MTDAVTLVGLVLGSAFLLAALFLATFFFLCWVADRYDAYRHKQTLQREDERTQETLTR